MHLQLGPQHFLLHCFDTKVAFNTAQYSHICSCCPDRYKGGLKSKDTLICFYVF